MDSISTAIFFVSDQRSAVSGQPSAISSQRDNKITKGFFIAIRYTGFFTYSLLPTPYSLLPTPYSLLPTPYSLLPTPDSRLPTPDSLLPTPYSLAIALFPQVREFWF
ncbi:MAG: hypothetical protein F6J90_21495 [Moorea sp. SIOASIH]|uniref:hypothetical protein n=1 Tax=Moorena sp. SIOASIH TaxID=2607817 RepID=UPI0013B6E45E|nr:hypothetical protein [Moorena sp. SIOASIH]NEO38767.1 hypothetical protein [Moorena sp. SIOASIH]